MQLKTGHERGDTLPAGNHHKIGTCGGEKMIRKLKSGEYRLYSRKKNPKTGKRRNLGTFSSIEKAKAHERAVQYFKRH
jgi:hypothetical protein